MEKLLTNKTVSMTELRDPGKVFAEANGDPVAVYNRNSLVGYIVPKEAVHGGHAEASLDEVIQAVEATAKQAKPVLDYLKDK